METRSHRLLTDVVAHDEFASRFERSRDGAAGLVTSRTVPALNPNDGAVRCFTLGKAARVPGLRRRAVHVWKADFPFFDGTPQAALALCSPDERARYERFRVASDRQRFVQRRAMLRTVLARYTDCEPGDIRFAYGPDEKPALAAGTNATDVRFNLSCSADVAVVAVARALDVGIDIERIDEQADIESLARRFFAADEAVALRELPADLRIDAFFNVWTQKEALLKAVGTGLRLPLDAFAVAVDPRLPPQLAWSEAWPLDGSRWHLRRLEVGPRFCAVLAVSAGSPADPARQ